MPPHLGDGVHVLALPLNGTGSRCTPFLLDSTHWIFVHGVAHKLLDAWWLGLPGFARYPKTWDFNPLGFGRTHKLRRVATVTGPLAADDHFLGITLMILSGSHPTSKVTCLGEGPLPL